MGLIAEPRPAELPLSGGRAGATVRVHPLLTGSMLGPPAFFLREEGRFAKLRALGLGVPQENWIRLPIPAFLVEHPGAGPVLVDTGFHPSVASDPKQSLRIGARLYKGIEMDADQAVPAQLRARGIDPAAVRIVVMTHMHLDHASGISELPDATFVLSAAEWDAAAQPRGQLRGYVRRQFNYAFDCRTLDFESGQADSFASFGRAFDLFGDGSVRVVFTPGHTHGHMSVVLRLAAREALLAGDAIYTLKTLRDSHLPAVMADEHLFRRSLKEIQLYAEATPSALIVPGHDWDAWRALDPVYG
jgi:glyoxylase-like metal-dependent hydrolase (beta-lactamase superfamily II)